MTTLNVNFIGNSTITDEKVRLRNNQPLRARNAAGSGDENLLKLDASDLLYFLKQPKFNGTASANDDLVNKGKLDSDLALYIPLTQKGAASGVAPLNASSKIDASYLPAIAITDVFVVASQAAQLALTAEEGDVAVRTDESKSYIHNGGVSGTMADWQELLAPGTVVSVNGQTGTVVLDTDDINEGVSNLYWTAARFNTAFSGKSTTDLAEGTNLYYTAARFNTAFAAKSTTDLAEGTNLYYTAARFNSAFAAKSTSDLTEGSNLYFTDARARAAQRFNVEVLTLSAGDISAGNVTLEQTMIAESEVVMAGGLVQRRGTDYTVSGTTLTFAGDMAAYLVSGDVIQVSYQY